MIPDLDWNVGYLIFAVLGLLMALDLAKSLRFWLADRRAGRES